MRIVTRPDFDGVVSAALLYEKETITEPILWVEPNDMQKGFIAVRSGDIIANLPFHPDCSLWFDHHYTNQPEKDFEGAFRIAPSAARVIFEYYEGKFRRDYTELLRETDRIDAADLTLDEVLHPEKYPYVLLSMTISGRDRSEEPYWNRLVQLVRNQPVPDILKEPDVTERCQAVIEQNREYEKLLAAHTRLTGHVTVTDFRACPEAPRGNRFLIYSMFPEAVVSLHIRNNSQEPDKVIIGVGHSIFNRNCNVNVGLMLSRFGGGGHRGAGSCTVSKEEADKVVSEMVDILQKNDSNE